MTDVVLADKRILRIRRSGRGRPLIMLHGWAMSTAVFSEWLATPLPGLELIAVDLPGHGGSDPGIENTLDAWAADVEELVGILELQQPALLGWSLGGMLALKLARRNRVDLTALVLLSSTPRFTRGDGWSAGLPSMQLRAMQRDLQRNFRRTMENFYKLMFTPGEIVADRYRQIARFATGRESLPGQDIAAAGLDILADEDLRPLLERLELPTLVVHGCDDEIIPVDAGDGLANGITGARLVRIAGAGHAPFLTRPEQTMAAVQGFLT